MEVQVQVAGPIQSKPVGNGTKFDIPLSNGTKPSTFDAALATKISSFGSGFFTATIEEKPSKDGQRIFLNIVAAELGATAGTPLGASVVAPNATGGVQATPIVPAAQNGSYGSWDEATTVRVSKLASYERAVAAVSRLFHGAGPEALEEMVAAIDKLAVHIYKAARSHEPEALPAKAAEPVAAVAADPQAVAAFVAEQAGSPVVQVGTGGLSAEPDALPW